MSYVITFLPPVDRVRDRVLDESKRKVRPRQGYGTSRSNFTYLCARVCKFEVGVENVCRREPLGSLDPPHGIVVSDHIPFYRYTRDLYPSTENLCLKIPGSKNLVPERPLV